MPEKHMGLGAEHPKWDTIQNTLILLIFASLALDAISQVLLGHSTILISLLNFPILAVPAVFLIAIGYKLVSESHRVILRNDQPKLVEDGVYSLVRHPLYLGELLVLLGLIVLEFSLVALVFWAALAICCDWAATYEERDLLRIFPEEYGAYQRRVPKWIPQRLRPA